MKNLQSVVVYHYDKETNAWSCKQLDGCLIFGTAEAYSLSDTQNRNASIIVRVMTAEDTAVFPEDVISFSSRQLDKPPSENCAVVVSVSNHRYGSSRVRHTKILCR